MKAVGKTVLAVGLLVLAFFLSHWISLALCEAIERWDHSFLFEYASEGQFDRDVYFSGEKVERTGILEEIAPIMEAERAKGMVGLSEQLTKYQAELLPVLLRNDACMAHLREQGASMAELCQFCENVDEPSDNLLFTCRYVLFLAWAPTLHFLMKRRPLLYMGMGVEWSGQ